MGISLSIDVWQTVRGRITSAGMAGLFMFSGVAAAPLFLSQSASAASDSTVVVTQADTKGWAFNRDTTTMTPYEFTENEKSIGAGSLYVQPISDANPKNKFIAEKALNIPAADLHSVAYDFLIAGNGDEADSNQFYLNVYTLLPDTTETYFSCRFDYVPGTGSLTNFTTATFNSTDVPTFVQNRNSSVCPAELSDMPIGSKVSFISLNVGDTSTSDAGLAGYLDKVVISTTSATTTYDFEKNQPTLPPPAATPESRDDCKNDGYKNFVDNKGKKFKNTGKCIKYVQKNNREIEGEIRYAAGGLNRQAWFEMDTAGDKGWFVYADANRDWYRVRVTEVKVDGKVGWFAGQVARSKDNKFDGNWLFAKVQDGRPDKIWGSFTTEEAAEAGVEAKADPADGPFDVTHGNLRIRKD